MWVVALGLQGATAASVPSASMSSASTKGTEPRTSNPFAGRYTATSNGHPNGTRIAEVTVELDGFFVLGAAGVSGRVSQTGSVTGGFSDSYPHTVEDPVSHQQVAETITTSQTLSGQFSIVGGVRSGRGTWTYDQVVTGPYANHAHWGGSWTAVDNAPVSRRYRITGYVRDSGGAGVAGVMVTRAGGAAGMGGSSAITDTNGSYTLSDVPDGTYTLTPSHVDFGFGPAAATVTVHGADVTANPFVAWRGILGQVTTSAGIGLAGVTVRLAQASSPSIILKSTTTDINGRYAFTRLNAGAYLASPVANSFTLTTPPAPLSGLDFSPTVRPVTLVPSGVTLPRFIAMFSVVGRVTDSRGLGMGNVAVTLEGTVPVRHITTLANGYFAFGDLLTGTYSLSATRTGVTVIPRTQPVAVGASSVGVIPLLGLERPFMAGRVSATNGRGVPGVRMARTGSTVAVVTNDSGYYGFSHMAAGTYTITPGATGKAFSPVARVATVSGAADAAGIDFALRSSSPAGPSPFVGRYAGTIHYADGTSDDLVLVVYADGRFGEAQSLFDPSEVPVRGTIDFATGRAIATRSFLVGSFTGNDHYEGTFSGSGALTSTVGSGTWSEQDAPGHIERATWIVRKVAPLP